MRAEPFLTPRQLQILLHYYACDCDYEHATEEELQNLVLSCHLKENFTYSKTYQKDESGEPLYERVGNEYFSTKYRISRRAYAHVGFLLKRPFPVYAEQA